MRGAYAYEADRLQTLGYEVSDVPGGAFCFSAPRFLDGVNRGLKSFSDHTGFLAVTFHELESIMMPLGRW